MNIKIAKLNLCVFGLTSEIARILTYTVLDSKSE